jgi:hypothetical protein
MPIAFKQSLFICLKQLVQALKAVYPDVIR